MMLTNEEFAIRLKNRLKEKNITQSELARRIDVSDTTISRYITGTARPRTLLLNRIAVVLDCSVIYFLCK